MTVMHFKSQTGSRWTAISHAKAIAKPIATVTRRNGRCRAKITTDRALSVGEMACLSLFMQERESA